MKTLWCSGGKCVPRISMGMLKVAYSCLLVIVISNVGIILCSSSVGDEYSWRQWKQNSLGRSMKARYSSEKQITASSKGSKHHSAANYVGKSRSKTNYPLPHEEKGRGSSNMALARQGGGGWGGGWPSSYGGGGSYDVYTIIAVAAFAALFGALIYELLGGSSRRSYDAPSFSMPSVSLGLNSEKLPEVMVKIGDWVANSSWFDSITNESRTMKNLGEKIGIKKWFHAFKKDPVEYQCIRKMACETLASSSLAERSLKTNFGDIFLTVFGNFIENGNELEDLVKQIVGNPKKCDELVIGGYCEEE